MIKAALFDIDGTLYSHKIHDVPSLNFKLLKKLKEKGIIIGICTSRNNIEMKSVSKELVDYADCIIMNSGAVTITKDNYYKAYTIDKEEIVKLIDYFNSNNITYAYSNDKGNLYYSTNNKKITSKDLFPLSFEEVSYKEYQDDNITSLYYFFTNDIEESEIRKLTRKSNVFAMKRNGLISPKYINKGFGLLKFCEIYKLTSEDVVSCGDDFNDDKMLQYAGVGIAVKDSHINALNSADYICSKSIEDGGLYEAFVDLKIIDEDKYEPKLFFFDIDSTSFCHVLGDVRESTYEAFRKLRDKGYKICLSTSRSISESVNLPKRFLDSVDYISYLSGAIIDMGDGLNVEYIDQDTTDRFVKYMDEHHICYRYSTSDGNSYLSMHHEKEYVFYRLYKMIPPVKKYEGEKITGFLCYPPSELFDEIVKTFDNIENAKLKVAIESYPKGVNKATTLRKMIERLNLKIEDTCAFGDSGNDILMIKEAGLGIAMGNGSDECKQAADYITGRTDEEGIYTALVHFEIIE